MFLSSLLWLLLLLSQSLLWSLSQLPSLLSLYTRISLSPCWTIDKVNHHSMDLNIFRADLKLNVKGKWKQERSSTLKHLANQLIEVFLTSISCRTTFQYSDPWSLFSFSLSLSAHRTSSCYVAQTTTTTDPLYALKIQSPWLCFDRCSYSG